MFADRLARWVGLGAAIVCAACAGNSAPHGWLPKPEEALRGTYGGWIELTYQDDKEKRSTDGELIAVSSDSIWVLSGNQAIVIPTGRVKQGKLTAYASEKGRFTGWTVGGTLATISNGGFLIFTAPMWIIGGSLATGSVSRAPERKTPPLAWIELAPFARFAQGLPEGFELTALEEKKVE